MKNTGRRRGWSRGGAAAEARDWSEGLQRRLGAGHGGAGRRRGCSGGAGGAGRRRGCSGAGRLGAVRGGAAGHKSEHKTNQKIINLISEFNHKASESKNQFYLDWFSRRSPLGPASRWPTAVVVRLGQSLARGVARGRSRFRSSLARGVSGD